MSTDNQHSTSPRDVEQLGIFAALASLSYVFWVCGGMEMVERLAYYGVRQVSGCTVSTRPGKTSRALCSISMA